MDQMYQNSRRQKSTRVLPLCQVFGYIHAMTAEDTVFDHHYEVTLLHLEQLSHKEDFSIELVKAELENLTKYQGLGWSGRGLLKEAEISGEILAYQAFIMRWERSRQ
jgi:hypothetical protein